MHLCISNTQSMVAVNQPPLQSVGLWGFAWAKTAVGVEGVPEEPVKIREVLSTRSLSEEGAAFDSILVSLG